MRSYLKRLIFQKSVAIPPYRVKGAKKAKRIGLGNMFLNKHSFPTFYGEFVVFVLAHHLSPVAKLPTSRFTIALGMEYIRLPSFYPSLHNTVTKH